MPTYEYECTKCRNHFEEFQKITDKPLQRCPKCKGKLSRLITGGVGVIFKGSGFYVTDYKKSNLPQKAESKKKDLTVSDAKTKTPEKPSKNKDEKSSDKK